MPESTFPARTSKVLMLVLHQILLKEEKIENKEIRLQSENRLYKSFAEREGTSICEIKSDSA